MFVSQNEKKTLIYMAISWIRIGLAAAILSIICIAGKSQTSMPEILLTGSLKEQANYIEEKTRIYDNYRAIREDMFQKIKRNAIDSLATAKKEIAGLSDLTRAKDHTIDSLSSFLESTREELDHAKRTKDSLGFLGFDINKTAYNSLMWTTVAVLVFILITGWLTFKRNRRITVNTKKEYEALRKEFEAYRKSAREAREKMSMAHFNELRKLRGG